MNKFNMGVIGTSRKEDEKRVPIHPDHLMRLPEDIRRRLVFEEGYGIPFNISDQEIATQTGGVAERSKILADSEIVIIVKPIRIMKWQVIRP